MNKLKLIGLSLFAVVLIACKTPQLEQGGAYSTSTNSTGVVSAPDPAFYSADALAGVLIASIDHVFKVEADNQEFFKSISPEFKKTLDEIRPQAWSALVIWAQARQAYMLHPTPAGLDSYNQILGKLRQISDVLATIPRPKTHAQ